MKTIILKLLVVFVSIIGVLFVVFSIIGYPKKNNQSVPYYSQIVIGLTKEVYTHHIDDLSVYGNTMLSTFRAMGLQNPIIEFPTIIGFQSYVITGTMDISGKQMTYRYYSIYPPNQRSINLTLLCEREGFDKVNNEIVHIINTMNFGEPSPADFENKVYVDHSTNLQFRYPVGWEVTRDQHINLKRKTQVDFIRTVSYNSTPNENTTVTTAAGEEPVPVFQYTDTTQDEWASPSLPQNDYELLMEHPHPTLIQPCLVHLRKMYGNDADIIPIDVDERFYQVVIGNTTEIVRVSSDYKTSTVEDQTLVEN